MPNNIPSAVSMLPQNKQSAASDALCTPLGGETLSEAPSKQSYDASVLLRAPLRTLNRADHSDTGLGKNAVRQHPSGVPALDSALRGVHVYKLSDGTMSCIFDTSCESSYHLAALLLALTVAHRTAISAIQGVQQ